MIFICLGNFQRKYRRTRHNAGKKFGEFLIRKLKIEKKKLKTNSKSEIGNFRKNKFGEVWELENGWRAVFLNCFMNESGTFLKGILKFALVRQGRQFQNGADSNLIVIHDDLDIPFGDFKIQFGRGSAGHKGVESIISTLGTQDFWRVRIGISNPEIERNVSPEEFVLMPFSKKEEEKLAEVFEKILADLRSRF